jgi:hypothetical protein
MVGSGGFVSFSSGFSPVAVPNCPLLGFARLTGAFASPVLSPPDLARRCASALCIDSDTDLLEVKFLVRAIFDGLVVCSDARSLDEERLLRASVTVSNGSGLLASGREELRGRDELSAAGGRSL